MKSHFDNESRSMEEITAELEALARDIDQRHRQQRKIQFLLDIRGYFVINHLAGSYVEFGLYRGEMLYMGNHILGGTGCITKFVGCDTFAGEPAYSQREGALNPFLKPGDFQSDFETTRRFLSKSIANLTLVKGDFRKPEIQDRIASEAPFAMAVVDCNVISSLEAALCCVFDNLRPGGVLFLDDLFTNFGDGTPETLRLLEAEAARTSRLLVEYNTYPPCARAYIIC